MAAKRKAWLGSGKFCAAINCSNCQRNTPELHFFRFPKDDLRAKTWVQCLRREDLRKQDGIYLYKNCVVCQEHFEDAMFMNATDKKRLMPLAKPTVVDVPNPPHRKRSSRPAPNSRSTVPAVVARPHASSADSVDTAITYSDTTAPVPILVCRVVDWTLAPRPTPKVAMPPSKGRMGLKVEGEPMQNNLGFRAVKNLAPRKKKASFSGKGHSVRSLQQEEGFQRLRIPSSISKVLPSVKKFSGGKTFVDITDDSSEYSNPDDLKASCGLLTWQKKGRGHVNRYQIRPRAEAKFDGMVWDVAFAPNGDIVVSCGGGVVLCDADLVQKVTLDKITLAGGVDFLSDGRIVAVCRFTDMINVYTPEGVFIRGFLGGESPMTVCVNGKDEILVADPGAKQVYKFSADGLPLAGGIARDGPGYSLKWPLYMTAVVGKADSLLLSDCHQQAVLAFSSKGRYQRALQLKTYGGNEVLRPHGLCSTADGELLVIDNAIDTVEVFKFDGTYMQTLVSSADGALLRPKVLRCNSERALFAIGGLQGTVHLYDLLDNTKVKTEVKVEVKTEVKVEGEVKQETLPNTAEVIVLD